MEESKDDETFDVRIVISSLGNERRTVDFEKVTKDGLKALLQEIDNAFNVIRANHSLLLTGANGEIVYANLDNVVFVEVNVGNS